MRRAEVLEGGAVAYAEVELKSDGVIWRSLRLALVNEPTLQADTWSGHLGK